MNFEIASTGSSQNYTRSYYLNGRDYIVSGSCDEHVVRICCAQTGRRLRDISLEVQLSSSLHIIFLTLTFCDVWTIVLWLNINVHSCIRIFIYKMFLCLLVAIFYSLEITAVVVQLLLTTNMHIVCLYHG